MASIPSTTTTVPPTRSWGLPGHGHTAIRRRSGGYADRSSRRCGRYPAGVAHKNLGQSSTFAVVGAYPDGQHWDMNTGKPGERPRADQRIARVMLPGRIRCTASKDRYCVSGGRLGPLLAADSPPGADSVVAWMLGVVQTGR